MNRLQVPVKRRVVPATKQTSMARAAIALSRLQWSPPEAMQVTAVPGLRR
jgi:hypothetical protein